MENCMNANKLCVDKNFVKSVMKKLPKFIFSNYSSEEIKSEVYISIYKASKNFDPKKGRLVDFVSKITVNHLIENIAIKNDINKHEVPIEAAYGKTYITENETHTELLAYFRTMPTEWLEELTDYVLGKKKKEDITSISDSSFESVVEQIDAMIY